MEWMRGKAIGRGSFCTVNLAIPTWDSSLVQVPRLMAVKSAAISDSSSLQTEKEILTHLGDCPQIVRCFGDDLTVENGERIYNVFLEYASSGTLADLLKNSGGTLPESDVRCYTRSILRGLCFLHEKGYVHCDLKLQNILVCSAPDGSNEIKIADFGLAKKGGEQEKRKKGTEIGVFGLRGTPLYMSPESVAGNEQEAPADVWSLGCAVAEMMMGKPAWKCRADADVGGLLLRIGFGEELPEIPGDMSEQGKDFLKKCFVRDPTKRWTAEMLLNHPFVADNTVSLYQSNKPSPSPRSAFDFPEWISLRSSLSNSITSSPSLSLSESYTCFEGEFDRPNSSSPSSPSPADRIRQLVTQQGTNWVTSDSWVIVR